MSNKVIIYLYNRLFDPVIQSNFWLFIGGELSDPKSSIEFHLVSYEDANFPLTKEQQALVQKWESQGLHWHKLTWHSGLIIKAKVIDIWNGFKTIGRLRTKGISKIISVASISGGFIYLFSLILPLKRYVYCYEPHSEYAADNNIWNRDSIQFKTLNWLEKKCIKNSAIVSSGTKFMEERIKQEWKFDKPKFLKIPTVVNDEKFTFSNQNRTAIRHNLGIEAHKKVLFYPGKFGDLYYEHEIARMYMILREKIDQLHFLIVSPNDSKYIRELFDRYNIPKNSYSITQSNYESIHRYFSAADFGIIADYFFTTTEIANNNLLQHGAKPEQIHLVGNTMIDTLISNLDRLIKPDIDDEVLNSQYAVLTLHRPSNVDQEEDLLKDIRTICIEVAPHKVIFPVHPRTQNKLKGVTLPDNLLMTPPMRYLEFIHLIKHAWVVITDSGGIQEETTYLKVPCLTLRDNTERPETIEQGTNVLASLKNSTFKDNISKIKTNQFKTSSKIPLWDGNTGDRIVQTLNSINES